MHARSLIHTYKNKHTHTHKDTERERERKVLRQRVVQCCSMSSPVEEKGGGIRLGYCRVKQCLPFFFGPPLIIQITLQCNRYGVQDVLPLFRERAGQMRKSK